MIRFLETYQEMRKAQNKFQKSRERVDQARAMQHQLQLDQAAPIMLELLRTEPDPNKKA